jgi:hypothetical protein
MIDPICENTMEAPVQVRGPGLGGLPSQVRELPNKVRELPDSVREFPDLVREIPDQETKRGQLKVHVGTGSTCAVADLSVVEQRVLG